MADAANSEADAEPTEPAPDKPGCESAPTVAGLAAELAASQLALAQAQAQAEAEADRALRAAAEAENARKRAERNMESARKFALERFVEDLLPAVDSFEQAVEAASAADAKQAPQALIEGVRLSLKLLVGTMERQGVAVVDPLGAPFDPGAHEAMTVMESPEAEPGSVTRVFQKGYTLNGRLVRAARVVVAKQPSPSTDGPDAAAQGADNAPGADSEADG